MPSTAKNANLSESFVNAMPVDGSTSTNSASGSSSTFSSTTSLSPPSESKIVSTTDSTTCHRLMNTAIVSVRIHRCVARKNISQKRCIARRVAMTSGCTWPIQTASDAMNGMRQVGKTVSDPSFYTFDD